MRPVIVEATPDAAAAIALLDDPTLLRSVERATALLSSNPLAGLKVRRYLLPKEYAELGVNNLWKMDLARHWRLLYTLHTDASIRVIILAVLDHRAYDALFGYRKR